MSGPDMHLRRDRGATPGCAAVAGALLAGSFALLGGTAVVKLAGLLPRGHEKP